MTSQNNVINVFAYIQHSVCAISLLPRCRLYKSTGMNSVQTGAPHDVCTRFLIACTVTALWGWWSTVSIPAASLTRCSTSTTSTNAYCTTLISTHVGSTVQVLCSASLVTELYTVQRPLCWQARRFITLKHLTHILSYLIVPTFLNQLSTCIARYQRQKHQLTVLEE